MGRRPLAMSSSWTGWSETHPFSCLAGDCERNRGKIRVREVGLRGGALTRLRCGPGAVETALCWEGMTGVQGVSDAGFRRRLG